MAIATSSRTSAHVKPGFRDLREWMADVEAMGELRRIDGVDWNLDLGGITDVVCHRPNSPAVLFDRVGDYPAGHRVLVNQLGSRKRLAYTWGIPDGLTNLQMVRTWLDIEHSLEKIPPRVVPTGPIGENVKEGKDVNLYQFPTPYWHKHDGGRYIATSCAVLTRDPETGWVNAGTYRAMLHDETTLGIMINRSRHGRLHMDKWFARGEPCPVVISVGQEPLLYFFASSSLGAGEGELDYVGGFFGEPMEVIHSDWSGLPIPARSEIVIEGEMRPGEEKEEGPFGEFTGYYAGGVRREPVVHVKRVWHRDNPILTGDPPVRPPSTKSFYRSIMISAAMWHALEAAGVPDVKGVWAHEAGATRFFVAVSIKQRYPGHARQAALIASQSEEGLRLGRYIIAVDDDIDPSNLEEVIWALGTRSNPERDINIITRVLTGPLDPTLPPDASTRAHSSRAVINACKSYEWLDQFPPTVGLSHEEQEDIVRRFGHLLD